MNGDLGARKNPARLANIMGTKKENPVRDERSKVVLIGVLVTHEFNAAIQLTAARVILTEGKK